MGGGRALRHLALGLGLGAAQPMMMVVLHRESPQDRIGEAAGLRLTLVNGTQTFLPTAFGAFGSAFGLAAIFWGMALTIGVGAGYVGRGLRSERRQRRAAGQAPRQAPEPASGRDGRLTAVRRAGRASEQRAESTSGRRAVVPATVDNDKPGERL